MTTFVHEQGFSDRLSVQCFRRFPCFSRRARRSSLGLKAVLVLLHVVFVGVLFLFDTDLTKKTREEPWYTAAYLLLFLATLIQYSIMASSSPGFVIDATTSGDGSRSTYQRQPASQSGTLISSTKNDQLDGHNSQLNSSSSLKLVMDFYPPGSYIRTWTCSYCNVVQLLTVIRRLQWPWRQFVLMLTILMIWFLCISIRRDITYVDSYLLGVDILLKDESKNLSCCTVVLTFSAYYLDILIRR